MEVTYLSMSYTFFSKSTTTRSGLRYYSSLVEGLEQRSQKLDPHSCSQRITSEIQHSLLQYWRSYFIISRQAERSWPKTFPPEIIPPQRWRGSSRGAAKNMFKVCISSPLLHISHWTFAPSLLLLFSFPGSFELERAFERICPGLILVWKGRISCAN